MFPLGENKLLISGQRSYDLPAIKALRSYKEHDTPDYYLYGPSTRFIKIPMGALLPPKEKIESAISNRQVHET